MFQRPKNLLPHRIGMVQQTLPRTFVMVQSSFIQNITKQIHPAYPTSIYYAFKQKEIAAGLGESSTGWETFIDAVIQGGLQIHGTWPMKTEISTGVRVSGKNMLASSVVLVCNKRSKAAPSIQRKEFVDELRRELPEALEQLVSANTAPVDMAQAALVRQGMAVFSKYFRASPS